MYFWFLGLCCWFERLCYVSLQKGECERCFSIQNCTGPLTNCTMRAYLSVNASCHSNTVIPHVTACAVSKRRSNNFCDRSRCLCIRGRHTWLVFCPWYLFSMFSNTISLVIHLNWCFIPNNTLTFHTSHKYSVLMVNHLALSFISLSPLFCKKWVCPIGLKTTWRTLRSSFITQIYIRQNRLSSQLDN